jgi:hypothetical protein
MNICIDHLKIKIVVIFKNVEQNSQKNNFFLPFFYLINVTASKKNNI